MYCTIRYVSKRLCRTKPVQYKCRFLVRKANGKGRVTAWLCRFHWLIVVILSTSRTYLRDVVLTCERDPRVGFIVLREGVCDGHPPRVA